MRRAPLLALGLALSLGAGLAPLAAAAAATASSDGAGGLVAKLGSVQRETGATRAPTPPAEPAVHPDHDRGLEFDVRTVLARRSALGLISGAGLFALVGCADGTTSAPSAASPSSTAASSTAVATSSTTATAARRHPLSVSWNSVVPDETAGPYPGGRQQRRRRARRLRHRAPGTAVVSTTTRWHLGTSC